MNTAVLPIVIASSNPGKLNEFKAILPGQFALKMQSEFDTPAIEETGLSFIENAILKARNASRHAGMPALADDSGLEVDALGGRPGVYSARFAGADATDQENVAKLLEELRDVPAQKRTARFHCVVAYLRTADDPRPMIFEGAWEGRIQDSPSGNNGFGYDPVFYVPSLGQTAAQLDPEVKNRISHRAQALTKLVAALQQIQLSET